VASVRKKRSNALYYKWYDHFLGLGKSSLDADLWAKILVERESCACRTCGHIDVSYLARGAFLTVSSFVTDEQMARCGESVHKAYVQYVECSDCTTVIAARRKFSHL
jgi:hypothetical protein